MYFTVYDSLSGEVAFVGNVSKLQNVLLPPGMSIMEGLVDGRREYVVQSLNGPIRVPFPAMTCKLDTRQIAADGVEIATLEGLPDPCTVTLIDPEGKTTEGQVLGGTVQFNTDLVGRHTIKVSAFPHLDWKGTFDAA